MGKNGNILWGVGADAGFATGVGAGLGGVMKGMKNAPDCWAGAGCAIAGTAGMEDQGVGAACGWGAMGAEYIMP